MSLPREPRQKMINMMYLVLTALLALNVSSEILNAFKTVNNSLEKTNSVITASTKDIMTSLDNKKKIQLRQIKQMFGTLKLSRYNKSPLRYTIISKA